jgi:micrococcal nuclease
MKIDQERKATRMRYLKSSPHIPKFLLLATAFFFLNFSPIFAQQPEGQLRTVSRVIDGDTIVLENGEKVWLIGVDTPETQHPQKPVEYFGKEATGFTRNLVEGQRVWVETDPTNAHLGHKDRYGRTLAYVWNERGKFVNAEIIQQGYGHALTRYPFKHLETFRGLEQHARQHESGLWSKAATFSARTEYPGMRQDYRATNSHEFQSASAARARIETPRSQSLEERTSILSSYENRPIVGHTATGKAIYEGSRGGRYHITSGGHRSYHSGSGGSRSGSRR